MLSAFGTIKGLLTTATFSDLYGKLANSGLKLVSKGIIDFMLKKKTLCVLYLRYEIIGFVVLWFVGLYLGMKMDKFRKDYHKNDSWKSRGKG